MFLVKLPVVPPDKNHTHTNWRECAKKYRSTPSSNKNKNCGGYDGTRSLDPWRSRLLLIVRVVGSRAGGTASDGLGHAGGHARGHRGRDVDGHHLSAVQAASGGTAALDGNSGDGQHDAGHTADGDEGDGHGGQTRARLGADSLATDADLSGLVHAGEASRHLVGLQRGGHGGSGGHGVVGDDHKADITLAVGLGRHDLNHDSGSVDAGGSSDRLLELLLVHVTVDSDVEYNLGLGGEGAGLLALVRAAGACLGAGEVVVAHSVLLLARTSGARPAASALVLAAARARARAGARAGTRAGTRAGARVLAAVVSASRARGAALVSEAG